MARVLIIDGDRTVCDFIADTVHGMGYKACCASSFHDGLLQLENGDFEVVFVNVQLSDGNGLDLLPRFREKVLGPEVIVMTAYGNQDHAELAIKNGAWDYIQKPHGLKNIKIIIARALQYQAETKNRSAALSINRENIIGNSRPIMECLEIVSQAASGNANSLICGETGTGKEIFAAAIHNNSARAHYNFVVVDCSALPDNLVESVLFGHEKGSYTGADRNREGLVAQAHKGTLFLDEIGELPLIVQKTFLRVIQERRYRPVGAIKEIESDFTLISATNRDLSEMVRVGEFRGDLLYRLNTIQINLPPLRQHKEDLEALSIRWVEKLCNQYKIPLKGFTSEFISVLQTYDWPGNVRELNQAIERALASAGSSQLIFPKDLPVDIRAKIARDSVPPPLAISNELQNKDNGFSLIPTLDSSRAAAILNIEHSYLSSLMAHTQGDIPDAVKISGLSRARFYALLKKHSIATSFQDKSDI